MIVAPTFNNAPTLGAILRDLAKLGRPIIVVNDGSTDATAESLRDLAAEKTAIPLTAIQHLQNQGKAAALRSGFTAARERGFTHALTIDTDGQHDVGDVEQLLDLAGQNPNALVLGARPISPDYPHASRIGRTISNVMVRIESGARVADSQCGLRVYPLQMIATIPARAGRYGYETEILTRAAWAGVEFVQRDIRCIYNVAGGRVSHFRPFVDSLHATRIHIGLGLRSLLPDRNPRSLGDATRGTGTVFNRALRWMNPAKMWRDIRAGQSDGAFPASAAVGMFFAVLPLYGVKTVCCLIAAKWLRLQPLIVLTVSSLNTPPTGPLLAALSIATGYAILHGGLPAISQFDPSRLGWWETFRSLAAEWVLGGIVCGFALAALTYAIASLSVRLTVKRPTKRPIPSADATPSWPATAPAALPPRN